PASLLAGQNQGDAKAQVVVSVRLLVYVAARRPAVLGDAAPAATSVHLVRAPEHPEPAPRRLRRPRRALTPLQDLSVHVVQAPGGRWVGSGGRGLLKTYSPPAEERAVVEVGQVRRDRGTEMIGGGGAGPAGVFPLGLGR